MAAMDRPNQARPGGRLPRQVVALGWVSLLTDAASDLVHPLLPALLASLGAGPASLGWVEGIAEGVSAVAKLTVGRLSDRTRRRKPWVLAGYGIATLVRPLIGLAGATWQVVAIRSIDRVGKGMRGPPRDALLAEAVPAERRGAAFGYHRMMDNVGASLGPLAAFALLRFGHVTVSRLFWLSLVPGVASWLVLLFAVRDEPRRAPPPAPAVATAAHEPRAPSPTLPSGARRYLVALGLFALAGSTDAFLLQRLLDLGLEVALVPIAWLSLQLAKALLNVPGGRLSDAFGRRRVLLAAWGVYALAYGAFGLASTVALFWFAMVLYALHYGLAEGGQRALLADLVPEGARGHAFGVAQALEGIAVLPANAGFGLLYAHCGARVAFGAGAAIAAAACVALAVAVPRRVPAA